MATNVSKAPSVKQNSENYDARKHTRRGMETRGGNHEGAPSSGHSASRYHIIKTIGKGNFAKVKLARHILTGQEVAIKIIDKTHMNPTSLQKLRREVKIMKMLDHPNIVKLYEVIETEKSLNLVMEHASRGELFDYLVANGRMKEKDARALFRQIISAIQYCHQKRILHRDLKAENLLLDEDLNVKIADFGFSNEFSLNSKLDTFCGSPPYAAPELFQGKKYDGPEVDVWSLGVILYTLVSGSLPFDGQNLKELRERVLRGKYRIPFYMTTDCENLLKKFLVLNPLKRATLETIMKDLWLNTGYEDNKMKPFFEPATSVDSRVIDKMVLLGFKRRDIEESLGNKTYNHLMATYLLLCRQAAIARGGCSSPAAAGCEGVADVPSLLTSKNASLLRATSLSEQKNNNKTNNNNNNQHNNNINSIVNDKNLPSKNNNNNNTTTQPLKAAATTDTTSSKVSRSVSAANSHIDKRVIRNDNFPAIQKTPNDLRLNATTTATAATPLQENPLPAPSTMHHSINVPQARSTSPGSNHIASNFSRNTMARTTLPPSALHSSEHIVSKDSMVALANQSVGVAGDIASGGGGVGGGGGQYPTPAISRSARKSFLHRISSKFYRNKPNRKSEGMVKAHNNNNNNRATLQQPLNAANTTATSGGFATDATRKQTRDLNNSLGYIDQPSNHLKNSNETFTSIATNSTTATAAAAVAAADKASKPRALHFTWHLRNTSSAEAEKMVVEIRQVLDVNHCDYYQTIPFVVHCSHSGGGGGDHVSTAADVKGGSGGGGGSHVEWIMEVCRLPRLSMNGVKFKRISGPTLIYKNIITKISNELKF